MSFCSLATVEMTDSDTGRARIGATPSSLVDLNVFHGQQRHDRVKLVQELVPVHPFAKYKLEKLVQLNAKVWAGSVSCLEKFPQLTGGLLVVKDDRDCANLDLLTEKREKYPLAWNLASRQFFPESFPFPSASGSKPRSSES